MHALSNDSKGSILSCLGGTISTLLEICMAMSRMLKT